MHTSSYYKLQKVFKNATPVCLHHLQAVMLRDLQKIDKLHKRLEGKRELESYRCPEEAHKRRSSKEWVEEKKRPSSGEMKRVKKGRRLRGCPQNKSG